MFSLGVASVGASKDAPKRQAGKRGENEKRQRERRGVKEKERGLLGLDREGAAVTASNFNPFSFACLGNPSI